MQPELPYLAAGGIALAGGMVREKGWPASGTGALVGTLALVVVASATGGSSFAPLVRAFGLLLLLVAIMTAVPAFQTGRKKGK